jgi:pimeloyl-ACP methyl ester carboxylesterase
MNPVELPHVDGVRHSYVDVDGLTLHVAEAGEGEPILLLHGWPENWYMWRRVMPALAPHFRVIAPDLRGLGWSDAPRGGYHKEQLATDILGLMDAMGLDRVRLMGHDWGGWTGFLMCLRQPERFERFIALNITPPWARVVPTLRNLPRFWYMAMNASGAGALLLRLRPDAFKRGIRGTAINKRAFSDEDLEVYIDTIATPGGANATTQLYRSLFLRDFLDVGPRRRYDKQLLEVPTLLMFGVKDAAIGIDMVTGLEHHGRDFRVELVPDCGHFIVDEKPDLVIERALELFGATSKSPTPALKKNN